ncbi:receptor-interacting serine/threonine-protein kinase 1-like [Glandiceps talaboti]
MAASDADFMIVSGDNGIGLQWKGLARELGLGKAAIDVIFADNHIYGTEQVIYEMLVKWKQRNGSHATKDVLINALKECNRTDIVDLLN